MANKEKRLLQEIQVESRERAIQKAIQRVSGRDSVFRNAGLSDSALAAQLYKKYPKLVSREYGVGIGLLEKNKHRWLRSLSDWRPRGKGGDTLFISLVSHLLAKYPVPKFLYCVFFRGHERHFDLFFHIAQGGSLFKVVGTEMLPVPLTRKMCHAFLCLPAETRNITEGLRTVQADSYGAEPAMKRALLAAELGRTLHSPAGELFWDTAIAWFCRNPMLDAAQIGPLIDYINHCRAESEDFSMKGRSVVAMIRGMQEWHEKLGRIRRLKGVEFKPAGLQEVNWPYKRPGDPESTDRWSITEILCGKELAAEGNAMRHCVYSYASSIAQGNCSIWSMRKNGDRQLTIEVYNDGRIVQVRGHCNRMPTNYEKSILNRWAALNNLQSAYSAWY